MILIGIQEAELFSWFVSKGRFIPAFEKFILNNNWVLPLNPPPEGDIEFHENELFLFTITPQLYQWKNASHYK